MPRIAKHYVAAVALLAAVSGLLLYRSAPSVSQSMLYDALLLCCLAIIAEFLSFLMPKSAVGSFGFIPFFAAAIIVPGWPSVLSVVLIKTVAELFTRRQLIKKTLNVSAYAVMELTAVLVYVGLGGISLRAIPEQHLRDLAYVTRVTAGPALAAFFCASITNNLIVTAAIALSSGRSVAEVLRGNHNSANVGLDFLAVPLIFVFAWVYAAFGAIAAATLWVPILGLRQVHRTNLELEQTNEELLELMVKSIEARDPYTSGHSRRVQQFSLTIARAIGLSERQVEEVGHAALLHDVGKIYEKYAGVLTKQDKLTPEEWAIIKDHPVDGANLIATMTRLRDLVPAVRHHHENWDGTGYPDRIGGDAIPIAARIIRFADTIDAMTTERPYRGPLSETQVKSELIRCRGTQFDPTITDRLLASALWPTLFTPTANETSIAPLTVVSTNPVRPIRQNSKQAARGA
jgi:putative nucleotidyltransferase with HDIG domain